MSDLALKNANAKRDQLASEINQLNQRVHDLRAELKTVDEWIAGWHRFAGTSQSGEEFSSPSAEHSQNISAVLVGETGDKPSSERTRTTGNPKKEVVAATARRIIEEAGQPVSRSDLFKELALRGLHIEGKDPEQVLSTMMWRTRESVPVVRLPSGGYWLSEQPHPASGYTPDAAQTIMGTRWMPSQDETADLDDDDDFLGPDPDHERDVRLDRETDEAVELEERQHHATSDWIAPPPPLDDELPPPAPRRQS